jgi:hypothetical protein
MDQGLGRRTHPLLRLEVAVQGTPRNLQDGDLWDRPEGALCGPSVRTAPVLFPRARLKESAPNSVSIFTAWGAGLAHWPSTNATSSTYAPARRSPMLLYTSCSLTLTAALMRWVRVLRRGAESISVLVAGYGVCRATSHTRRPSRPRPRPRPAARPHRAVAMTLSRGGGPLCGSALEFAVRASQLR